MPFCNHWHGNPTACGLIFYPPGLWEPVPVPLKSVKLRIRVIDFVAQVELEQEYINSECSPIEAKYSFPVEEEAAVIDFKATLDGRTIQTKVEEKEEARNEYQDAVKRQRTAFLVEEHSPDVFQIKVGHLKPGAGAKIVLKYITELPVAEEDPEAVRLTIPTTIAPRYTPPSDNSELAQMLANIKYSLDTPAPLTIETDVISKHKIISIASPSHSLKNGENQSDSEMDGLYRSKKVLQGTVTDMDRDFVLLVHAEQLHEPRIFMETSDELGGMAGMVSLVPNFKLAEQKTELIFLVDRSGSMAGHYNFGGGIAQAKESLQLFLHSLPVNCMFDIYSFGSRYDSLFNGSSAEYTDDSLQAAKDYVRLMDANYGGTEIYSPLQHIFEKPLKEDYLRQIFVLTDGAVSNSSQVVKLVKEHNHQGRVFSLGLGASASRHLVKGIARAGGGTAVFAATDEDLRPKVMSQLKNALQPAISKVSVEWKGAPPVQGIAVQPPVETKKTLLGYMQPKTRATVSMHGQAPARIPPIYDGHRLLAYRLFEGKEKPTGVMITAQSPAGPLRVDLDLQASDSIEGSFVHQLAARKRIQDLEEDVAFDADTIKQAITELGLKYNLASKHTSFVGADSKQITGCYNPMLGRDVPNQIPHSFGHSLPVCAQIPHRTGRSRSAGKACVDASIGGINTPPGGVEKPVIYPWMSHVTLGCNPSARPSCASFKRRRSSFKAVYSMPAACAGATPSPAQVVFKSQQQQQGLQQQLGLQQQTSYNTAYGPKSMVQLSPPFSYAAAAGPSVPNPGPSFASDTCQFYGMSVLEQQQQQRQQQRSNDPVTSLSPGNNMPTGCAGAAQSSAPDSEGLMRQQLMRQQQQQQQLVTQDRFCNSSFLSARSTARSGPSMYVPYMKSNDPVTSLMNLQLSSGEFKWGDELAAVLKLSKLELVSIAEKSELAKLSEDEPVWVSVACICYLETKCADKKDIWELMVIKSKKFISKKIGDSQLDNLLHHFKAHMGF